MAAAEPDGIRLRGLAPRARVRAAVLALTGASASELRAARAWAERLGARTCVVAVDGGLESCRDARIPPDLWVGDGDSSARVPPGIETVRYETDKAFSDLGGALAELRRRRIRAASVAGLVGGRLDHEWANLFELGRHAPAVAGFVCPTRRGTVIVTAAGCTLSTRPGSTVSLFALGGAASVTLSGTRWELDRRRLTPGSRGLSNVAGPRVRLTVHRGAVALLVVS